MILSAACGGSGAKTPNQQRSTSARLSTARTLAVTLAMEAGLVEPVRAVEESVALLGSLQIDPWNWLQSLADPIEVHRLTYVGRLEQSQLPFMLGRGYCRQTHSAYRIVSPVRVLSMWEAWP